MHPLREHSLRLKRYLNEYSSLIFRSLSLVFYPAWKLLESIDILSIKVIKPSAQKLSRFLKTRLYNRIAHTPYIVPSLALAALFFISLLLFSSGVEGESTASIVKRLSIETPSVITASLEPARRIIVPKEEKKRTHKRITRRHYIEEDETPDIEALKGLFLSKALIDISRGLKGSNQLSLTFDGGEKDHAREILDILKEKGIETTFFLTGRFIRLYPELVSRIVEDGHEVGNHTMSHPHLTNFNKLLVHTTRDKVTKEYFLNQLNGTAKLYRELVGEEMAPYWRAPYGELNKELTAWALEAGYVHVGWTRDYELRQTLDSLDWVDKTDSKIYYTAAQIKERILTFDDRAQGLNGAIILMHLGTRRRSEKAVSVLADIIDEVRSKGFSFVKVSMIAKNLLNQPFRKGAPEKLALK